MISPDFKEFQRDTRRGNLVPVWTSIPADLLTPVSAYLRLTRDTGAERTLKPGYSFLLESVEGGENVARYTYMGADPFLILRYRLMGDRAPADKVQTFGIAEIAEKTSHGKNYRTRRVPGDIAEIARDLIQSFHPVRSEALPPFSAEAGNSTQKKHPATVARSAYSGRAPLFFSWRPQQGD